MMLMVMLMVYLGNYEELAMGGGLQEVAQRMVRNAAQNGTWVCLKNLHLVVAWLPALEKELSSLEAHQDFRLFLTTEAHGAFTSVLLQQSLKATFESPPGIKMNLQRTFDSWDPETFDPRNAVRSRLLFLLACFHAVMQERRTYIPQGWTKFYEFSYGDLRAGTYMIEVQHLPRPHPRLSAPAYTAAYTTPYAAACTTPYAAASAAASACTAAYAAASATAIAAFVFFISPFNLFDC